MSRRAAATLTNRGRRGVEERKEEREWNGLSWVGGPDKSGSGWAQGQSKDLEPSWTNALAAT
jgi:hypothetical protein